MNESDLNHLYDKHYFLRPVLKQAIQQAKGKMIIFSNPRRFGKSMIEKLYPEIQKIIQMEKEQINMFRRNLK